MISQHDLKGVVIDNNTVVNSVPARPSRNQRRRALHVFPVTFLLLAQYLGLVIYPAIVHQTAPLSTILEICIVAICSGFVIELLLVPIRASRIPYPSVSLRSAKAITVIGWIAQLVVAHTGQLGYASQISEGGRSSLAALATPFQFWALFGMSLIYFGFQQGQAKRFNVLAWTGATLGIQLFVSLQQAILAPFFVLTLTLIFLGLLVGLFRLRIVVLLLILLPILWPAIYAVRNQIRISEGANATELALSSSSQRLRLDLEMAQIQNFSSIPADLPVPGIVTLVRFGIIPSVIDRSRGNINSAQILSTAMGGSSTNSASLTTLGELYVEQGWGGLIIYGSLMASMVGYFIRRRGPWALVMIAIVVSQFLWIGETVPDYLAGFLQTLVSLLVVWIVVKALSGESFGRRRRPLEVQSHTFSKRRSDNSSESNLLRSD